MVFNNLGTEVLRIDHAGAVGIGSGHCSAWTSHEHDLGHWAIDTQDLAIVAWLVQAQAQQDELGHWICTRQVYTMFVLRWGDQG